MTYNLTLIQENTDVSGLFTAANDFSGQLLFTLMILAISIVMLMIFLRKGYEFPESLLSVSFVGFALSGLVAWAGYINIVMPISYLTIAAFTMLFLFTRD